MNAREVAARAEPVGLVVAAAVDVARAQPGLTLAELAAVEVCGSIPVADLLAAGWRQHERHEPVGQPVHGQHARR